MSLPPIAHELLVDTAPAPAFELFAERIGDWWPLGYTFSRTGFASAEIEPRAGGRWFERTLAGAELPWGEVRVYEPARRLVLGFGISPERRPTPPDAASEVEVTFTAVDPGRTRVRVEHRAFERHGDGAARLREGMDSDEGWPLILAEFRRETRSVRQIAR